MIDTGKIGLSRGLTEFLFSLLTFLFFFKWSFTFDPAFCLAHQTSDWSLDKCSPVWQ